MVPSALRSESVLSSAFRSDSPLSSISQTLNCIATITYGTVKSCPIGILGGYKHRLLMSSMEYLSGSIVVPSTSVLPEMDLVVNLLNT